MAGFRFSSALLAAALCFGWLFPARAHDVSAVSAVLDLRQSGEHRLELAFNLKRGAEDALGPVEAAARFLEDHLTVTLDGAAPRYGERETEESEADLPDGQRSPVVTFILRGAAGPGDHAWEIGVGPESPAHVILAVVRDGKPERRARVLLPGEETPLIAWILGAGIAGAPAAEEVPDSSPGLWETLRVYLWLGFTHILPHGLDHILFVLGLFFLSREMKPLLWQVTGFTVAHTITLALATLGWVQVSPRVVEPLIALSIAYVAVEDLVRRDLTRFRLLVVFILGLVHGLGFAGVLAELGLPRSQLAAGLVSFNIGVELGQLAVIGLAFLAVLPVRNRPWYRRAVVIPCCLFIAATGLFWTVQRLFFA